ncbi:hypothetical protein NDU88_000406 [Pleurodeles waltl]|uniref:Uncharacterized protein n=1 Tax=Pleurodeles waltl TaxID=8319 RepID=A0AAV7TFE5_PLEWA|nr:hypothetical protein NDU88_000406 [Pleurodeles waltl]
MCSPTRPIVSTEDLHCYAVRGLGLRNTPLNDKMALPGTHRAQQRYLIKCALHHERLSKAMLGSSACTRRSDGAFLGPGEGRDDVD